MPTPPEAGLDITGWTRQPVGFPILDGDNPFNIRSGSGTGHGLTVDRYTAPYASVSGATSDEDVQDGSAYTAASSAGSPCTLFCALANAIAGHTIQTAAGIITVTDTGSPHNSSIKPAASGTSLDPITFVAEYPSSHNTVSTVYTQVKRVGGILTDPSPIFGTSDGTTGQDYVVFDGYYINYAEDGHPGQRGLCYINDSIGSTVRRFRFDRENLGADDNGDNFNCVQAIATTDTTISNNIFNNGFDSSGHHNEAAVTTYQSTGLLFEHNELINVTSGLYLKGDQSFTVGNQGIARFNKFVDCKFPIATFVGPPTAANEMEITQNLVYYTQDLAYDYSFMMQPYNAAWTHNYNVHHNTFIVPPSSVYGGFFLNGDTAGTAFTSSDFVDNIVACLTASLSEPIVSAGNCSDLSPWNQFDYNWYYNNGSDLRFQFDGVNYTNASALADWRTNAGVDANSQEGDPEFEDAANYDFRLAVGAATRTASSTGQPVGCYITGTEEIGLEANPSY